MKIKNSLVTIIFILIAFNLKAEEKKFYYNESDYITFVKKGTGSISLIYVHGFGLSKNSWDDFYPLFDSTKYTSYLIDLKGFGHSSIPKDNKYSLKDNKDILAKFIDSEITQDYYLFGHSYGGGVSLFLTSSTEFENKPKLLVLFDCAAYSADYPFFIKSLQNPIVSRTMFLLSTPKIRAKYTLKRIIYKENYTPEILDRCIESIKGKHKKYSLIKTAKQIFPEDYEQLIARYSIIKTPTLIIWGKKDEVLPSEQGKRLSLQIKNSKMVMIDTCGHIPQEEKPMITFKIVETFINSQER